VAGGAIGYARMAGDVVPAVVNGHAGAVAVAPNGRPFSVMAFTVVDGRITAIDALNDPEQLARIDLSAVLER
jgi:RNA polymerase sigma-70 factor (ECF subfamily)